MRANKPGFLQHESQQGSQHAGSQQGAAQPQLASQPQLGSQPQLASQPQPRRPKNA